MAIVVDLSKCDVCGDCVIACPTHAITCKGNVIVIDESLCTLCKRCVDVCPSKAISEEIGVKKETDLLSLIPQKIEIIKAEPIPVQENPTRSVLSEIVKRIIPRLLEGVIYLMDRNTKSKDSNRTKIGNNQESTKQTPKRHRHQKRG